MGRRGDEFTIILDINAVFSSDELALVKESQQENKADSSVLPDASNN